MKKIAAILIVTLTAAAVWAAPGRVADDAIRPPAAERGPVANDAGRFNWSGIALAVIAITAAAAATTATRNQNQEA